MNIAGILVRRDQLRIARERREDTELDLRIIGVDEDAARLRHENGPETAAQLRPHRDVLQVRIRRRDAPRRGHHLIELPMDAAIRLNIVQKPLRIGRVQLRKRTVIQDIRHDLVVLGELLKHIRRGRVTGLRLLAALHAELSEQDLPELLRRVDVELLARLRVDPRLQRLDAGPKLHAIVDERLLIDEDTGTLHIVQCIHERHLNLLIERPLLELLQLRENLLRTAERHDCTVRRHGARHRIRTAAVGVRVEARHLRAVACIGLVLRKRIRTMRTVLQIVTELLLRWQREAHEIAGEVLVAVAVLQRIDDVGREREVVHVALRREGTVIERLLQVHGVEPDAVLPGQRLQLRLPVEAVEMVAAVTVEREVELLPGNGEAGPALTRRVPEGDARHVRVVNLLEARQIQLLLRREVKARHIEALQERLQLQPLHKLEGVCIEHVLDAGVIVIEVDRGVNADGREGLRQRGTRPLIDQHLRGLRLPRNLELRVPGKCCLVRGFDGMVLRDDPLRGLRTEARHARDVIGGVAHQRLEVDELERRHAPLLHHIVRIVIVDRRHALRRLRKTDLDLLIRKLQEVAVTGDDRHLHALLLAALRDGAEQVIRLVAALHEERNVHRTQHLLHQRNLLVQLRRHRLPCPLIGVKHLMAECRLMHIEGHRQMIRLLLIQHLQKDIQETIDRVCMQSLRIRQLRNPVKRPGHDAVSIDQ